MLKRRLGASAIVYLIVLAVLTNFFLVPSQSVGDGIGGWPVGQSVDSTIDTAPILTSTSTSASEPQNEVSEVSLLTLLWEVVKALL